MDIPESNAFNRAVWSGSTLFVQDCLSKNLGSYHTVDFSYLTENLLSVDRQASEKNLR